MFFYLVLIREHGSTRYKLGRNIASAIRFKNSACPKRFLSYLPKFMNPLLGMCLKENYSDSPSNEYSRHYSAEFEYLRRQDINSKSGEEQKNGHHVCRSPNFDSNSDTEQKEKKKGHHVRRSSNFNSNSDTEQKKGQNDDALGIN